MKRVRGYIAADGTFHQTKADAELHEARTELTTVLTNRGVKAESFINLCESHIDTVERYINAYRTTQRENEKQYGAKEQSVSSLLNNNDDT